MYAIRSYYGFGKVVAVGEYLVDPAKNIAEIAFSVSKEWQGKGLGKIIMNKLSDAASYNFV